MASHRHTILVIDDDDAIRALLQDVLGAEGTGVLVAEHGHEALAECQRPGLELCAILMDLMVPHRPWLPVLEGLRRLRPDVPVIAMSASAGHLALAAGAGAPFILQKPFNLHHVFDLLDQACPVLRAQLDRC